MQAFRPWASQLWFDVGGELADITCGDPWYKEPDGKDPGFSLILARTFRGKKVVEEAAEVGYLKIFPAEIWKLENSQIGLIQKKGSIWGRRLALKTLRLPIGHIKGGNIFHCWLKLSTLERLKSIVGTYRRVLSRALYKPLQIERMEYQKVPDPFIWEF